MVDSEMETGSKTPSTRSSSNTLRSQRTTSRATGSVPRWPDSFIRGAAPQDSHSRRAIRGGLGPRYLSTRLRTMPIITKLGSVWPTTPIQMLRNRFAG